MNFIGFLKVKVANPNTGEETEKLRVKADNGQEFDLLTDLSKEEIIAQRESLLKRVLIGKGPYKPYAYFRMSEILEEF